MTDTTQPAPVPTQQIPETPVTLKTLTDWYNVKLALSKNKIEEALLRTKIFKYFFKEPKEGTNKALDDALLGAGYHIEAKYPIARKIDEGIMAAMKPQFIAAGISLDKVVAWKPEVSITEYRKLTAEQQHLFDQCLEIKPGTPQVAILKTGPRGIKAE